MAKRNLVINIYFFGFLDKIIPDNIHLKSDLVETIKK